MFNEVDRTGSLIQYIGIGDGLEPHLLHLGQRASDHKFVLTSDGVHRDKEMLNTVSRETRAPEQLVDRLLLLADLLGGHDNATAVVIPGRMELEHSRLSEFALVLEFNSPFGEMEIWITEIGDRAERNHFFHGGQPVDPARLSEKEDSPPSSDPELIEPEPRTNGPDHGPHDDDAQPARGRRRSRKPRKAQQAKNAAPTDDDERQQAKIEFPKVE